MPTIRIAENKLPSVSRRAQAPVYQRDDVPAAAFGVRSESNQGGDLFGGALKTVDKFLLDAKKLDDEADAKKADTLISEEINKVLLGAPGDDVPGFLHTRGEDATNTAGAAQKHIENFIRGQLEGLVGYKRRLIETAGADRLNMATKQILDHAGKERNSSLKGASIAREAQAVGTAVSNYKDDDVVAQSIEIVRGEAQDRAGLMGLGEEATEVEVKKQTGIFLETVVNMALAQNDPRRAEELFDRYAPGVDATKLTQISEKLAADVLTLRAQEIADAIQEEYGLGAAGEKAIRDLYEGKEETAALVDYQSRIDRYRASVRFSNAQQNHNHTIGERRAKEEAVSIVDRLIGEIGPDYDKAIKEIRKIPNYQVRDAAEAELYDRLSKSRTMQEADEKRAETKEKKLGKDTEVLDQADDIWRTSEFNLVKAEKMAKEQAGENAPLRLALEERLRYLARGREQSEQTSARTRREALSEEQRDLEDNASKVLEGIRIRNPNNEMDVWKAIEGIKDQKLRTEVEKQFSAHIQRLQTVLKSDRGAAILKAEERGEEEARELIEKFTDPDTGEFNYSEVIKEAQNIQDRLVRNATIAAIDLQRKVTRAADSTDRESQLREAKEKGRELGNKYATAFAESKPDAVINLEAARAWIEDEDIDEDVREAFMNHIKQLRAYGLDDHAHERTMVNEAHQELKRRQEKEERERKEKIRKAEDTFTNDYLQETPAANRRWDDFEKKYPEEAKLLGPTRAYWRKFLRSDLEGETSSPISDRKTLRSLLRLPSKKLMNINEKAYALKLTMEEQKKLSAAVIGATEAYQAGPKSSAYTFAESRVRLALKNSSKNKATVEKNTQAALSDIRGFIAQEFIDSGASPTPEELTREIYRLKTTMHYDEGWLSTGKTVAARIEALDPEQLETLRVPFDDIPLWLNTAMLNELKKSNLQVQDLSKEHQENLAGAIVVRQKARIKKIIEDIQRIKKLQGQGG